MKSIIAIAITLTATSFASAQPSESTRQLTIHDMNKTVELCQSMKDFKGYCPDAAKACAQEKTYEDKRACLQKQSR